MQEKVLYRVGGISGILLGLSYLVITVLYVVAGSVPSGDGAEWLTYFQGKEAAWWGIVGLSVLTDLLFLPFAAALYRQLGAVNRNAVGFGVALLVLFAVLDLAVTWPNYAALIRMSADAQANAAAATYASSLLGSGLFAVYAIFVPALGIALVSLALRRFTRYLGWTTGVFGVVAVIGLGVAVIIVSVLTLVWIVLVGIRLLRCARS